MERIVDRSMKLVRHMWVQAILVFGASTAIVLAARTTLWAVSFRTIHSFCSDSSCPDGAGSSARLIQAINGNLYGTTFDGGANGFGTVFSITATGTLTTLYSFCSESACADGENPFAGLIQTTDGNLYGTTSGGGTDGDGTIFQITPNGTLITLHSFGGTDGANPAAPLIQARNGKVYGTANLGGGADAGTFFKIISTGALANVHSFNGTNGALPREITQATNGNIYGVTLKGGVSDDGTIFELTRSNGKVTGLTTLYNFCSVSNCADGESPQGLIQASDGNLYGTAGAGGPNLAGTIFQISSNGTLTTLYSFCSNHCLDGENPNGGLLQTTNGNLCGTTFDGGTDNDGTVFCLSPNGLLTTLHSFDGADGQNPVAGLVQATNGNLYGTTTAGGAYGSGGTVFEIAP